MAGRPKAEIPTIQLSFRLREDEHALFRAACERLGLSPGRLLGRLILAAYGPAAADPARVDPLHAALGFIPVEDYLKNTEEP